MHLNQQSSKISFFLKYSNLILKMKMMYLSVVNFSIILSILILSSFFFKYSKQSFECLAVDSSCVEGSSFCYI